MSSCSLLFITVLFCLLVRVVQSVCPVSLKFNYDQQTLWNSLPGSQCGGNRQSPIDITTALTTFNSSLIPLQFRNWNNIVRGEYINVGYSVNFVPKTLDATVTNHLGTYIVLQIHFHWGSDGTQGSEHTLNNMKYAAEIHFVCLKKGYPPITSTLGDTYSVVGVLCEAADIPIEGTFWEQLFPVPSQYGKRLNISALQYDRFLPPNKDYYHYDGSLTTPPCSEIVEWFLLKQSIKIPNQYLNLLRQTQQNSSGSILTYNFHSTQPLNGRLIYQFSGRSQIAMTWNAIVIVLFLGSLGLMQ